MDGVLVIDKPVGPTSHDIVAVVRRVLRERRVGHTGTLDPLASGVLPLVLGRATRLASLLSATEKTYEAGVRLGGSTATYDAAERVASGAPPPPAPATDVREVARVLDEFRGEFDQMPPPYSAKKVGGVAAYKLARRHEAPALKPVRVRVSDLEMIGLDEGLVRLRVTASAGFYVRSLAHDIGVRLGCGAHLEALRRTGAAGFGLDRAVTIEELQGSDSWRQRIVPLEEVAGHIPALMLNERGAKRARHGNAVGPGEIGDPSLAATLQIDARVRLFDPEGALLAIAIVGPDGVLRPSVVLV